MVALPSTVHDLTLDAVDAAIEASENNEKPRGYLGFSGLGHPCARKNWYDFRWASRIQFKAKTLKLFADGHYGEALQAKRLRMVEGIKLFIVDDNGNQFGFVDETGHARGHMDGAILGILEAKKTWHVWEHKQVAEKKQSVLQKLKEKDEKSALAAWDQIYYAQAILYMHFSGMTRHYLTCASPGGRHTISVRTEENPEAAIRLIAKAQVIINAPRPPERISEDPAWFECRFCDHRDVCHGDAVPEAHCRSCMFSTPIDDGKWNCAHGNALDDNPLPLLDYKAQCAGCPAHLYIPDLIHGAQTDAGDGWVEYQMADGSTYRDGVAK
jgi:CRISPR/Cas system-associated exonuclease Cas4 (RecB family)